MARHGFSTDLILLRHSWVFSKKAKLFSGPLNFSDSHGLVIRWNLSLDLFVWNSDSCFEEKWIKDNFNENDFSSEVHFLFDKSSPNKKRLFQTIECHSLLQVKNSRLCDKNHSWIVWTLLERRPLQSKDLIKKWPLGLWKVGRFGLLWRYYWLCYSLLCRDQNRSYGCHFQAWNSWEILSKSRNHPRLLKQ